MFNAIEPTDPYARIEKLHHTPKWYNKPLCLAGKSSPRKINELVDNITQLQHQVKKISTSDLSDTSNLPGLAENNLQAFLCQQKTRIYKERAISIQGSLRRTPCHPFRNQPWKKKKIKEINTVLDLIEGTVFKTQRQIINTVKKLPEPEPEKKPEGAAEPATQIPTTAFSGEPLPQNLSEALAHISERQPKLQSPQERFAAAGPQAPSIPEPDDTAGLEAAPSPAPCADAAPKQKSIKKRCLQGLKSLKTTISRTLKPRNTPDSQALAQPRIPTNSTSPDEALHQLDEAKAIATADAGTEKSAQPDALSLQKNASAAVGNIAPGSRHTKNTSKQRRVMELGYLLTRRLLDRSVSGSRLPGIKLPPPLKPARRTRAQHALVLEPSPEPKDLAAQSSSGTLTPSQTSGSAHWARENMLG